MAVRIYIEIGHEASIRTKKTQEGFTHDWEVFVRGCDGAEIQYYIEKVVFYLHETFPKPKRVIKEPPYTVKESGYAGFNLPIDIYLRNNGEPKKVRFNYDLHLQQSGPAILKVQKEKYVFNNVSDEFRAKLLKGGGTIVSSSSSNVTTESLDNRSNFDDKQQMINKPKLAISSSDIIKKPKLKISDNYSNDNFHELFGSPIITTSKTAESKQPQIWKDSKNISKSDKEKWRTKHSPHKDRDKDKDKSKDKIDSDKKCNKDDNKKMKEKLKDRERSSKDKDRNMKKERSPSPPKRSNSPKNRSSPPTRLLTSPLIIKHKDSSSSSSSSKHINNNNNDNNNKDKRDKADDKKAKKEKRNKEHKENKQIDDSSSRLTDEQQHRDKTKLEKDVKRDSIKIVKNDNPPQSPQLQKPKKEKSKDKKDKDQSKEKYKSKKKDKEKKDDKEKKAHKSDKKSEIKPKSEPIIAQPQQQPPPPPLPPPPPPPPSLPPPVSNNKTTPIKKEKSNFLIDEDSSSSSSSSASSLITTTPTITATAAEKKSKHETAKSKDERILKTNKKERNFQDNQVKYNKRKSNSLERDEPPEKLQKDSNVNNNIEEHKDIDRNYGKAVIKQEEEDYLNLLRDLQHKIMGLKDNNDLTKVVQLIAETGRYEVSAHTFDFDLCLLDRSTVQQLQNFFANEY